jgi:hypothetical protein
MKLPRRRFLHLAAGAAALPVASQIARAQAYPTRPVRIIVPFPAGQATDSVARLMAQSLSERLGQGFVIENRTGAGGNIGTEVVLSAPTRRVSKTTGRDLPQRTLSEAHRDRSIITKILSGIPPCRCSILIVYGNAAPGDSPGTIEFYNNSPTLTPNEFGSFTKLGVEVNNGGQLDLSWRNLEQDIPLIGLITGSNLGCGSNCLFSFGNSENGNGGWFNVLTASVAHCRQTLTQPTSSSTA